MGVASGLAEEKVSEIQPVELIQEEEPQMKIVKIVFNHLNNAWIDYNDDGAIDNEEDDDRPSFLNVSFKR